MNELVQHQRETKGHRGAPEATPEKIRKVLPRKVIATTKMELWTILPTLGHLHYITLPQGGVWTV